MALAAGLVVAGLVSSAGGDEDPPWQVLDSLRQSLESSSQTAVFTQHYHPAGFSTGDVEGGTLYLSLPSCVRWDYTEPDTKSFLLCDTTIHTWVEGDPAGRRFELGDSDEPGIDLLRLQRDDLRVRYRARIADSAAATTSVVLTPISADHPVREARLEIDGVHSRLLALEYEDRDGNLSRFEIEDFRPLADDSRFTPPAEVEWLDR